MLYRQRNDVIISLSKYDTKGVVVIKRRIVITLLSMCLFCLLSITAFAADPVIPKTSFDYKGTDVVASANTTYRTSKAYFKDEAELLTTAQKKSIWEKIQSAADGMNIKLAVFLGGNYRTDNETERFTYDCAVAAFGANSDSLFIYLDFEGYSPAYDYIRAFNNAEKIFNETKRNKILQSMYQYLPKSGDPIYQDDVNKAIVKGIEELSAQYRNGSSSSTSRSSSHLSKKQEDDFINFLKSIPIPVYIVIGIIILVLIVISKITKFIRGFSSRSTTYYDNDSYYDHDDDYYSSHSYRRPPRRPPHRERPPRRPPRSSRSHSSSRSSSHSSGSSSSGSGHHR